jgi:hypothetical protein
MWRVMMGREIVDRPMGSAVNLTGSLFDPETTRRYANDECFMLALALNRLFGLEPLFCERRYPPDIHFGWSAHWSFWHCAVGDGGGGVLDASGLSDKSTVLLRLAQASPDPAHWRIRPLSSEAVIEHFIEDEGGQKHRTRSLLALENGIAAAVDLIRGLPELHAAIAALSTSRSTIRQSKD